jgi:hypothetical protein
VEERERRRWREMTVHISRRRERRRRVIGLAYYLSWDPVVNDSSYIISLLIRSRYP